MNEPTDTIHRMAAEIARWVMQELSNSPPADRESRLALALESLRPEILREVTGRAAELQRAGYLPHAALERSLVRAISDVMLSEIARNVAPLPCTTAALGLGDCSLHGGVFGFGDASEPRTWPNATEKPNVPPEVTRTEENDDIVRHNRPPKFGRLVPKDFAAWEERQYRGLWYPGYRTAIVTLTPDDVALATAFVGGKLTRKDCPRTDTEQDAYDEANKTKKIFSIIEEIAGMIATIVMGIIYGPAAGAVVNLAHQGKMWLINEVWKDTVKFDPAAKVLIEQMRASFEPYKYGSYGYHMLPLPLINMMVQELGCTSDLMTRLLLHGRMLRTLDAMQASSPAATSAPWLYTYPSAFGLLKGSIFPPRGPAYDGVPPPEPVMKTVAAIKATRPIQSIINKRIFSPSQLAKVVPIPPAPPPPNLERSAKIIQTRVADIRAAEAAHIASETNHTNYLPYAVAGGGALALLLAVARRRAA